VTKREGMRKRLKQAADLREMACGSQVRLRMWEDGQLESDVCMNEGILVEVRKGLQRMEDL
jgi:hypothetical protein